MNRIKTLRLARGLTQEQLVRRMGRIVTKQALSKYENDKATPSPSVAISLARALGVKTAALFVPPKHKISFVAYRRHYGMSRRVQDHLKGLLAEQISFRLELQERLGLTCGFHLERQRVATPEEAETIADYVRELWNLGGEPIANLTDVLERRTVHVIKVEDAPEKFHGIAALALDDDNAVCGAGVAFRGDTSGERQRFTLAHEFGHLVMQATNDEEEAAHRFASSLLMPAEALYDTLGRKRSHLGWEELYLLKEHFGISIQAIIYRAWNLAIITNVLFQELFKELGSRGWRKQEPHPLPPEEPNLWTQLVSRALAERQITHEEARAWGFEESGVGPTLGGLDPRALLNLPKTERQRLLRQQAEKAVSLYAPGGELAKFTDEYMEDEIRDGR